MKQIELLTPNDLLDFPVWEYVAGRGTLSGQVMVETVKEGTITHLSNRIVGTYVALHDESLEFSILGNLDLNNLASTQHFLVASFFRDGRWFHLARYHDSDYDRRGPDQLAFFLKKEVANIFPISYDLSQIRGLSRSLSGLIYKNHPCPLPESELIQLALRSS